MKEELSNTFGEDFAESFEKEVQKRRQRRNEIDDETMRAICAQAVNQNEFDGGDPMFEYTDDAGITHNVLLMQVPEMEEKTVFSYANELETGAVTMPMDYMGEWMSCLFNEGKELVREFEEGDYYLVAGNLGTYTTDSGEENEQMSPVRGVASLEEVKQYAAEYMEEEEGIPAPDEDGSDESSSDDTETSEDDSSGDDGSDDGGLFGDDNDEDEEEEESLPVDEIQEAVDALAEKDERVWEIENGDDHHQKLSDVVSTKVGVDNSDELSQEIFDYVESQREDEEEEEDEDDNLFG